MPLIPIEPPAFDVMLDLRYAKDTNFTGRPVYARGRCLLVPEAAALMKTAIDLARPLGYRFKVFDAYRPTEAQWKLWAHTPDPEFLADPSRGSPHSRGVAIDLTLIDAETGAELDMGTDFDAFLPQSHHGRTDVSEDAQRNRAVLLGIMTAAGWDCFLMEWWHYQLFQPRRFPLLSDSAQPERMMA